MLHFWRKSFNSSITLILSMTFSLWANESELSAAQKAQAIFQKTGIYSGFAVHLAPKDGQLRDRKSTRLNSSH